MQISSCYSRRALIGLEWKQKRWLISRKRGSKYCSSVPLAVSGMEVNVWTFKIYKQLPNSGHDNTPCQCSLQMNLVILETFAYWNEIVRHHSTCILTISSLPGNNVLPQACMPILLTSIHRHVFWIKQQYCDKLNVLFLGF